MRILIGSKKFFRNAFLSSLPDDLEMSSGAKLEEGQEYKDFISAIVAKLYTRNFEKGDIICNKYDPGEELFIISKGETL